MKKNYLVKFCIGLVVLLASIGVFIKTENVKFICLTISLSILIALFFLTIGKNVGHKKTMQQYENELND